MAQAFNPDDDPGWPRGRSALMFLVPGALHRRTSKAGTDGLFVLRQVTTSFVAAFVLFGVVLPLTKPRAGSPLPWFAILVVTAIVSVVATRAVDRPLDCSSPTKLAGSYRTRFFLRIAFADTVALFGFTFAFIGGAIWLYFVGAAFTIFRILTGIAPTRSALERDQRVLRAQSCELSLIAALRCGAAPPAD